MHAVEHNNYINVQNALGGDIQTMPYIQKHPELGSVFSSNDGDQPVTG